MPARSIFLGEDVTRLPRGRHGVRRGLARSFQIVQLLDDDTALANVALAVQAHAGHSASASGAPPGATRRCSPPPAPCSTRSGWRGHDARVADLSHGERKVLELAVALAARPKLLLLDEPMAGLGAAESIRMTRDAARAEGPARHPARGARHGGGVRAGRPRSPCSSMAAPSPPATADVHSRRPRGAGGLSERGRSRCLRCSVSKPDTAPAQVLFDVSLRVGEGEVATLLGRNGMGKTTTVRAIMGLNRPRAGRVELRGAAIAGQPPERVARAGIGLVPEGRMVFPTLERAGEPGRHRAAGRLEPGPHPRPLPPAGRAHTPDPPAPCRAASSRCWRSGGR